MNDNVPCSDVDECRQLVFKHLPAELTDKECFDFLNNLGAVSTTRVLKFSRDRQKYYVAEFPSVEHAWNIVRAVHQRPIANRRVSVEFFRPHQGIHTMLSESDLDTINLPAEPFRSVPIAPRWDPCLPVPLHLKYKYPAPTKNILTNVVRCMMSCPSFYTQVLHLMNRLHLPPPFGDTDMFPGNLCVICETDVPSKVETSANVAEPSTDTNQSQEAPADEAMDFSTSTESELDSDEDRKVPEPVRRRLPRSVRRPPHVRLASKRVADTKSLADHPAPEARSVTHVSDLFDTIVPSAKLQLHVPEKLPTSKETKTAGDSASLAVEGGFGVIRPQMTLDARPRVTDSQETTVHSNPSRSINSEFQLRKDATPQEPRKLLSSSSSDDDNNEDVDQTDEAGDLSSSAAVTALSLNDLRLGRLTEEERQNYPVFARGYQPGEPTSRLYIKNLAPLTTEHDLYRVFGAFQSGPVADLNTRPRIRFRDTERFSIRLLTEGRMKGQAFVSLQCELTALQALEATNGFLLHERPMVVQFARGAKAKVDEKSLIQTT